MIRKLTCVMIVMLFLQSSPAFAGTEGSEDLSKSGGNTADECFEGFSRAMFKLNHGLDKAIFEPVAIMSDIM